MHKLNPVPPISRALALCWMLPRSARCAVYHAQPWPALGGDIAAASCNETTAPFCGFTPRISSMCCVYVAAAAGLPMHAQHTHDIHSLLYGWLQSISPSQRGRPWRGHLLGHSCATTSCKTSAWYWQGPVPRVGFPMLSTTIT